MAQIGSYVGTVVFCTIGLILVLPDKPKQPQMQAAPSTRPSAQTDRQLFPTSQPPAAAATPLGNGLASFVIQRATDSHFYADAEVNGATVHFLVDTGATGVILTSADAQRAGISGGDFTQTGIGAGGEIQLMPATVNRLALGPLTANDVPVMVAKDKLAVSLLGQSYLSRIGTLSISGNVMTLQ